MELEEFFDGRELSRQLFDVVRQAVETLGDVEIRVTKSQVAFSRGGSFAWAWIPDRYLSAGHAPLVLSVSLRRHDESPRWKEVVEPSPGRFMHHLELHEAGDIDGEVRAWLQEAAESAGQRQRR